MLANAIVKETHFTQHQLASLADPGFVDVLRTINLSHWICTPRQLADGWVAAVGGWQQWMGGSSGWVMRQ